MDDRAEFESNKRAWAAEMGKDKALKDAARDLIAPADTLVEDIPVQTHRPRPWGPGDNPKTALNAYLTECDRFVRDAYIDAKLLDSANPGGYLRCTG